MKLILLLTFFLMPFSSVFGQNSDNYFIGKWITEPISNGMIKLIRLNEDGTGITGPGRYENGNIELSSFMKSDLQNWKIEKDTLILTTTPISRGENREPESRILMYVIVEKKKNSFSAYYSDPKMDKIMEDAREKLIPIKLIFKKVE